MRNFYLKFMLTHFNAPQCVELLTLPDNRDIFGARWNDAIAPRRNNLKI